MLPVLVALQAACITARHRASGSATRRNGRPRPGHCRRAGQAGQAGQADQAGQATAEYALVLLGVAAVALLLAAWATKSGKIGQLFDAVIGELISKAK